MSLQINPQSTSAATAAAAHSLAARIEHPVSPLPRSAPKVLQPLLARALLPLVVLTGFLVILAAWQRLAPEGWRPAQIVGYMLGDGDAAKIATSLAAEKAKVAALLEEQARMQKEVIAAQTRSQELIAAAQSQAQQEIAAMQVKAQVAQAAYQTLFERSNQLALIYGNTVQSFMKQRLDVAVTNTSGNALVGIASDVVKGFAAFSGDANLMAKAESVKQMSVEAQMRELDSAMSRAVPRVDAAALVAQGLPDPAQFAASLGLTPQVQRPLPLPEVGIRPSPPPNPFPRP